MPVGTFAFLIQYFRIVGILQSGDPKVHTRGTALNQNNCANSLGILPRGGNVILKTAVSNCCRKARAMDGFPLKNSFKSTA
jgi:hypothetical protein